MDLNIVVERIYKNKTIKTWLGEKSLGDAAVVRAGETQLILVSRREIGYGLSVLKDFGIDRETKQYLVFKYIHDCENEIPIFGDNLDYRSWPANRIARPKYPWDKGPFSSDQIDSE